MVAKLTALLLAVLVVGGFGAYYSISSVPTPTDMDSASLPVAERGCCASKLASLSEIAPATCELGGDTCCAKQAAEEANALAAFGGSMTFAINTPAQVE